MIADELKAAVGPIFDGRFYPLVYPQEQKQYPYATYQHIANTPEPAVCAGITQTYFRIQITIVALTYGQTVALRKQVRDVVLAMPALVDNELDNDAFDEDHKAFVWFLDFTFRANEA